MKNTLVGSASGTPDAQAVQEAQREVAAVIGDIATKLGSGALLLDEAKRFAKRENPFSPARISKKLRTDQEHFYGDMLGMTVDFSDVTIPDNPGGFNRVIIVAQGLTIAQVIAACRKRFEVHTDYMDLDNAVTKNERTAMNGHYAIRVRDRIEADEELKDFSANNAKSRNIATETLLEQFLHGLKYFRETGNHLDVANWTLCAGSRASDDYVPRTHWSIHNLNLSEQICVRWFHPDSHAVPVRPRAVVS